jgi:hypothetical protein
MRRLSRQHSASFSGAECVRSNPRMDQPSAVVLRKERGRMALIRSHSLRRMLSGPGARRSCANR